MTLLHRIAAPVTMICFLIGLTSANVVNGSCIYLNPVQIKSMDVGNMLSWSTYEEVDNKFFVIQKSTDGITFKKIGDVKGAGYSTSVQTYRFLDFSLGERKTYYRLLHYSFNGSYTVSETFFCERTSQNNLMITSMSSTMTDGIVNITIKSIVKSGLAYEIKNYQGKVLKSGNKKVTKGLNVLSFDCSQLKEGRYDLELFANGEVEKITIRKVKSSEMPKIDYKVKKK